MFERELVDVTFLQRWGIVRTLRPQSVAEHTFLVAHYVNDLCHLLSLPSHIHLSALQYALWHDVDEVFTGDLPGPNKRGLLDAIGPDAKTKWDNRQQEWSRRVFPNYEKRSGNGLLTHIDECYTVKLLVKLADWLEASVRMATESQLGNACTVRHILPNRNSAIDTAAALCEHLYDGKIDRDNVPIDPNGAEMAFSLLTSLIAECVDNAWKSQSVGPWVTKEDEKRTYDEPCVR